MRIGGRNYNVKTGLTMFLVISVVSAMVLLYLDVDKNTWVSLKRIKFTYGLLAVVVVIIQWCLNGLRYQILVNSLEEDVSFWVSLKGFLANIFMSAMTPSQTGGGPLQIYVLNRAGVPIAKAFSGCLMGAVLTVFCLISLTTVILLMNPGLWIESGHHIAAIFGLASAVFLFMSVLFIISIFNIKLVKRIVGRGLLFLAKATKIRSRLSITKRAMRGLDQYSKCMSIYARTKKHRVVLAGIVTMMALSANAMLAPILLSGLNIQRIIFQVFLIQFILFFIAYFSPTPGASGIAEFTNYWMMNSFNIDQSMLGVYTVIWRFFTSFIGVGIGGLVVLTLFRGKGGVRSYNKDRQLQIKQPLKKSRSESDGR